MVTLPLSRVPDPATAPVLSWGVIGTGWIAERFVAAAGRHAGQRFTAVGSRTRATAQAFAQTHGIPRAHGSYAELVADPAVDVVYVATPHPQHLPHARLALEAGKHVLVEKPLGLNAAQAREISTLAAERGLFCAEAMWTMFLPKFDVLRQLLDDGAIGTPGTVLADHGEWFAPGHRILRADLAGGPMLDLGTYPFALAEWVLGEPSAVQASGQSAPGGVNGQTAALLSYPGGAQALLHTTLLADTPTGATIAGSAGTIVLPGVFYRPGGFTVTTIDGSRALYDEPAGGYEGLAFEAAETARQITAGAIETPQRPLKASIATLAAMDAARAQIGVTFPGEEVAGPGTADQSHAGG